MCAAAYVTTILNDIMEESAHCFSTFKKNKASEITVMVCVRMYLTLKVLTAKEHKLPYLPG